MSTRVPSLKSQTLRAVGEDALIALLTRGISAGAETLVGVGDDCAVLGKKRQRSPYTLFKTDCIVEGVHYTSTADPAKVGWKAMARVVSDIAAMGGWPVAALATVVWHPDTSLQFARGVYRGFAKAGRTFDFDLVGGETSQLQHTGCNMISVSMLGKVEPDRCVLRSTANAGDEVFVTGRLGGSIKGRHLTFQPRLSESRWLVEHCKPSAMMDISDGIAKDLSRLAAASGLGYSMDRNLIPRNRGCDIDGALNDGEDYELLLTFNPKQSPRLTTLWKQQFPRLPLTRIGQLNDSPSGDGLDTGGWDHFG